MFAGYLTILAKVRIYILFPWQIREFFESKFVSGRVYEMRAQ